MTRSTAMAMTAILCSLFAAAPVACASASQVAAPTEAESRTAAQRKIDSQLLYEIYRLRGQAEAKHVPPGPTTAQVDAQHRALVDVRVEVTDDFLARVKASGGAVLSSSVPGRTVIAWVPLLKLEDLADDSAVRAIQPAPRAIR